MIKEPYKNLFCDNCKHRIVVNGEDRCKELKSFVINNPLCSRIFECRHFEKDKNKI